MTTNSTDNKNRTLLLILGLWLILPASTAAAADVRLMWDPNTETTLGGYKVHVGTAPRTYTTALNAGKVTDYTVMGLAPGTYFFAVTAYDLSGQESDYSNEVTTKIDTPPTGAPVISNVAVTGITRNSANVTWMTDKTSDTQVDYGETIAYGASSTLNPAMVLLHTSGLMGLREGTLYHFRVKSRDVAGNLAISGDYTFTTLAAPDTTAPVISGVSSSSVTSSSATISWNTNESSNSQVEYGETAGYGASTTINPAMVLAHSATLAGLKEKTLYHFRVKSRDAAGNLATSGDYTFTTPAALDTTPPVISGVSSSSVTPNSAVISWNTNEASDSLVEYGESVAYGSSTFITSKVLAHTAALAGLKEKTLYHFRVKSRDAAGNLATSGDYTFTTLAGTDTTAPVISGVSSSSVASSSAVISWNTNEASDTQVEYGETAGYGASTVINPAMVLAHSAALAGLKEKTLYHFRVKSRDAAGNLALSGNYAFTTLAAPDTKAPVISSVLAASTSSTSVAVSWNTSEASDSMVEYGESIAYGSSNYSASMVLAHAAPLAGLKEKTLYHFRVKSRDAAGNLGVSGDFTFTTAALPDASLPVITSVICSAVTSSSAWISWNTDKPCDSQVEYGETAAYGLLTPADQSLATVHSLFLSGLKQRTLYHFRVKSRDAAGKLVVSADFGFSTSAHSVKSKLTLPLPRNEGQQAAGQGSTEEYLGVALVNLDTQSAALEFTAYDATGTPLTGPSIVNPVSRILGPGEQLPVITSQLFGGGITGSGPSGWIRVESSSEKVTGFYMIFNSSLTLLDGANISTEPVNSFVFPQIEEGGYSRVNIANPNSAEVGLQFGLYRADGTTRGTELRKIAAGGSLQADLMQGLFPEVRSEAGDYVRVEATNGVVPFMMMGKEGSYLHCLNGQSTARGSMRAYSPQLAFGGPYRSTLSVVNLDPTPGEVALRFIRDDGTQIGPTRTLSIPAYGKASVEDPAFFGILDLGQITQGYVELTGNGARFTGSVTFGDPEKRKFASSLPLASELKRSVLFSHLASNDLYFTGIAILNPNEADAVVTLDIFGADGKREGSQTALLPARTRQSRLLTEYFPSLVGIDRTSGYLRITADRDIAAFALFGTGDLSVLSAIPPQDIP